MSRHVEQLQRLAAGADNLNDEGARSLIDDRAHRASRPAPEVAFEDDDVMWMGIGDGLWGSGCGGSVNRTPDDGRVPRISTFYGIVIAMYYRDHAPPHFHAVYGEYEATVIIETLEVLSGYLPGRALRLVREWGEIHGEELATNWQKARAREPLATIEPLA